MKIKLSIPKMTINDVMRALRVSLHAEYEMRAFLITHLETLQALIKPEGYVYATTINDVNDVSIIIENGINIEGAVPSSFKSAETLLICMLTMGEQSERIINDFNKKGQWFEASMFNQIFNILFEVLSNTFDSHLEKMFSTHNFTEKIEFGNHGFETKEMHKLFPLINTETVRLSNYASLSPQKTIFFMVGIGSDLPYTAIEADCRNCDLTECPVRKNIIDISIEHDHVIKRHQVQSGQKISRILEKLKYPILLECLGKGTCKQCSVLLSQADSFEKKVLACETILHDNTHVRLISSFQKVFNKTSYDSVFENFFDASLGVAIDLGTTTLAAYLVDLDHAQVITDHYAMNPQIIHGRDVISRIQFTLNHSDGLEKLHHMIHRELSMIIKHLCNVAGVAQHTIKKAVIVGNTAMQQILHNQPIHMLGYSPFEPYTKDSFKSTITVADDVFTFLTPGVVSGFIGGDVLAGVLSLIDHPKPFMLVDLGTNGELVLVTEKVIIATSTAAGPALEGGAITHGMGAVKGAITKVLRNNEGYTSVYEGERPIGFCGSGILSFTARLIEDGYIDKTGRINGKQQDIALNEDLTITQADIREIQLVKSAIRSGFDIILKHAKIEENDLSAIYVTGGYGHHLSAEDLVITGFFPRKVLMKIKNTFNTAASGAIKLLVEDNALINLETLKSKILTIDLSKDEMFSNLFIEYMSFEHGGEPDA
jgi:uncharacterized 2Fe-2S/4Fe-4S cluster protein (DUF4445 family)